MFSYLNNELLKLNFVVLPFTPNIEIYDSH